MTRATAVDGVSVRDGAGTSVEVTAVRDGAPAPTAAAPAVVDCAAWLSAGRRPRLSVPLAPCPAPTRDGTGAGVRIALLDAPVDLAHPDLRGARVRTWAGPRCPEAPDGTFGTAGTGRTGRSTSYATLLVGQGTAQVRGLVPAADLLVAPVLDCDGRWVDEVVARAVRWAMAGRAAVIVLPFGRHHLGRRVTTTLRASVAGGARVFAAAGDLGPDVLAFPASVTGVVAVTGHDAIGLLPGCSLHADLAAPGHDVPAGGPDGLTLLQGTGAAAVLAAGAYAAQVTELTARWSGAPAGALVR
ncbi:S8/S53 family peptidase [Actinotalea sp.]|uniref:S8/S53 family peptidase n=1 Tax=Actinotalea sp. TaxID=1872145 RepID=UPI002CCDA61A|nr:S8/S53 family peptidase [Actinotalea sp.]HQY34664.1 S8/S53 family peptidase [Actinotalea sp.]HRA51577.1 S8/S53 family peptidase [Actinotalea sp.]